MLEGLRISETIVQIFASVGFVLLGAAALTVASAISGYSIFRELPSEQARIFVLAAGAILFILSPLGYLIFYPKLFSNAATALEPPEFAMPLELWDKIWNWRGLFPFCAALVGFGLMSGAIQILGLRKMVLSWLRERTGIGFRITSYELDWDSFLRRCKNDSPLIVNTKSKTIIGRTESFSIRQEPHAIILRNFTVLDRTKADEMLAEGAIDRLNPFRTKIASKVIPGQIWIDGAEIESMSTPASFLKKHKEHADHSTQGSYLLVAAVGALLMALAAQLTGSFLRHAASVTNTNALQALSGGMSPWYDDLAAIGLSVALVFLFFASTVPVKEYTNPQPADLSRFKRWFRAAKATYGMEYQHIVAVMIGVVFGGAQAFCNWSHAEWRFGSTAILTLYGSMLILTILSLIYYRKYGYKLHTAFDNRCDKKPFLERALLEQLQELLDELYFCLDVNFETKVEYSYSSLKDRLLRRNEYARVADPFFRFFDGALSDVAMKAGFNLYEGNEFNVLAKLRRSLQAKLQLARATHPDERQKAPAHST